MTLVATSEGHSSRRQPPRRHVWPCDEGREWDNPAPRQSVGGGGAQCAGLGPLPIVLDRRSRLILGALVNQNKVGEAIMAEAG